ncbi:TVP38/TMEM64 family protein [Periweissella beninensis]|uniref:TVP38/TMEM64 family protein n=1 Tax=Periweissella beninensis TaxID=504936 RepID=UPI0021A8CB29|nr:VTT domain-containing protein [Periweissella beninensis]MCT4396021.1 TVP38/TMEM64 family protein [Periweissella beninensis]
MKKTTKIQTYHVLQIISYLSIIATLSLMVYLWQIGAFTNLKVLQKLVGLDAHPLLAPLIFIALQICQIIIPIIPGALTLTAGVLLFGPWWGFLYNYLGIIIGSTLAFLLARYFGGQLLIHLFSLKQRTKYLTWLDHNERRFAKFFIVAILLPGFPDDLLTMIAGLSKMSLRTFCIIILIAKPLSIASYSGLAKLFIG